MSEHITIKDARKRTYFMVDNELLDVYGGKDEDDKGIGIYAIGVYTVLARYADNDTHQCYPSYNTIARILGISRNKVIDSVAILEKRGLISITQQISQGEGKPTTNNIYTILDIKQYPGAYSAPGSTSGAPGVVHTVNHPSAPEVPYKDLYKNTQNKNTSTRTAPAKPVKSEAVLIEEWFLEVTKGGIGGMSPIDREAVKDLVSKGFTLDRVKPGVMHTLNEMRSKNKSVGTIRVCIPSIVQLDPDNKPEPASFTSYQQRNNYGRPRAGTPEYDNYMKAVDF